MQEDKFGQQAKMLMEELRLRPSDFVWPNIEARIRRRRRRRFLFILIPVAAGVAALLLLTGPETSNRQGYTTEQIPVSVEPAVPEGGTNQVPADVASGKNAGTGKLSVDAGQRQLPGKKTLPGTIQPAQAKQQPRATESNGESVAAVVTPNSPTEVLPENQNGATMGAMPVAQRHHDRVAGIPAIWGLPGTLRPGYDIDLTIPEMQGTNRIGRDQRVHWGLNLATGLASYRQHPALFSGFSSDARSAPVLGNTGGGNYQGQPPYIYTSPENSQPGPAFQLGVIAAKPIGGKGQLITGLSYLLVTDRLAIGQRIDQGSTLNGSPGAQFSIPAVIFRGNAKQVVTNRYHFAALPVLYEQDLLGGNGVKLSASAGISVSQLISTNALSYTATTGGYYARNSNGFHRTQVAVLAGAGIRWGREGGIQWTAGPQFRFSLTPLRKEVQDPNQYLFSGSMQLRMTLPRKSSR